MNTTTVLTRDDIVRFFSDQIREKISKDAQTEKKVIYLGKTTTRSEHNMIRGLISRQSIYMQIGKYWVIYWQVFFEHTITDENFESVINNIENSSGYFNDGHFLILYSKFQCKTISLEVFRNLFNKKLRYTQFLLLSMEELRAKSNVLPHNITIEMNCPRDL